MNMHAHTITRLLLITLAAGRAVRHCARWPGARVGATTRRGGTVGRPILASTTALAWRQESAVAAVAHWAHKLVAPASPPSRAPLTGQQAEWPAHRHRHITDVITQSHAIITHSHALHHTRRTT
jgi:hypothetical protein